MIKLLLNILVNSLIFSLSMYSIYGMFSFIKNVIRFKQNEYDELQRKIIFDSLGYSMIVILILHSIERIVEFILYIIYPDLEFYSILNSFREPGTLFGQLSIFDKIFFDCAIISIVYIVIQYKYELITKKKALRPMIICLVISLTLFFVSNFIDYLSWTV